MKTETWQSIFLSIVVFAVIIIAGLLVLVKLGHSTEEFNSNYQLTYNKCCGGSPCTDTYYSEEDGKCHSTWEDQNYFQNWYIVIPMVFGVALVLLVITYFLGRYGSPAEPEQVMDSFNTGEPR